MVIIKQRYKKNRIKKVISFFFISKRTFSLFRIQSTPDNNKEKEEKDKSSHTKEPQIQKCRKNLIQMIR
jgi:hypothetical protein